MKEQSCILEGSVKAIERSPFSFFQTEREVGYNSCTKEVVFFSEQKDINHWFGTIVILAMSLAIVILLFRHDKKRKDI